MTNIAAEYAEVYEKFHEAALGENAKNVRLGKVEVERLSEEQAHFWTQRHMCQTNLYYLATKIYAMDTARRDERKIWHPPLHSQLCDELGSDHDSLIHMSRNMLKTTVGKIWVVQQIIRDPVNVSIGMWSRSSSRVRDELKSIGGMLKNKALVQLFPDRLIADERKWEKRSYGGQQPSITVTRKVATEDGDYREVPMDEAQIEVWGLESTVTGRHYTHHYYDDLIDRDNTATANQIEKAHEKWAAMQAMKSPDTIEKMIGTPWHQLDLYATAEKEGYFDNKLELPGVLQNGTIVYPYFTREFLDKQRRKLGEYLYSCQYLLDTRPKSMQMFNMGTIQYWSDNFPKRPRYYIAVDPSTGRSQSHDKTGIAVGAVDAEAPTELFYVEADRHTWLPEELASEVVKRIIKYCPERVGIEYGQQFALESLIDYKMREARDSGATFPTPVFVDIKTGGGSGGLDKGAKIDRTLGALVREHRAWFKKDMLTLFRQMVSFNPNVQKNDDDVLDACGMLVQTVPYFHQAHSREERSAVGGLSFDFFKRKVRQSKHERIFAA